MPKRTSAGMSTTLRKRTRHESGDYIRLGDHIIFNHLVCAVVAVKTDLPNSVRALESALQNKSGSEIQQLVLKQQKIVGKGYDLL